MNYRENWKTIIEPILDDAFLSYDPNSHRNLQFIKCWSDGSTDRTDFLVLKSSTDEMKQWSKNAMLDAILIPLRDMNPEKTTIEFQFMWS